MAELLSKVLHEKPRGSTHWSVRSAAEDTGISKSSVARYFALFGVQPHRAKSFKLSSDPYFVEKVRDIVGLYLSPPTNALVLCVDEKSQYDEAVHVIARAFGQPCTLLSNSATARHRHQEFISFLNHIDKGVPAALDVHMIVDNYATHKLATSSTTTFTNAPLSGPLLQIRSSPKSSVYVKLFLGHNTDMY